MKYRTPILDYDTAVGLANLCLMNVQKSQEALMLRDKWLCYQIAFRQYVSVRRYALDVIGWCRNTGNPIDTEALECTMMIRSTLRELKNHLNTLSSIATLELEKVRAPRRSETRLTSVRYN